MKNSARSFFKYNLINNLKSVSFYITALLSVVFVFINYFIRYQFFTGKGTSDLLLYFTSVPYICILAIPSLCYKQPFSVYDSFVPLKNITRCILKFLSVFVLYAAIIILLIPGTFIVNIFGSIDIGQVFTSIICLLFYGSAVITLCLLINEIFENKIAAFIVSAVILAIFNSAHLFTVYVNLPSFLTDLFKQLSFAWHFDAASKGIIDTRDILWLTGASFIFLILSAVVTDKKKGRKFSGNMNFQIIMSILICFFVMLNGNRWFNRIDLSKVKIYSPSSYTKELVSKISKPVKITYYRSSKLSSLYPQIRDVSDFLTTYASLNKNITLLVKDPDKDKSSATLLRNYGITSQQLRTVSSNSAEFINVYSAIVIEYNGNAEVIPFVMTADTLEYDIDGRIKHLLTGIPRIVNIIMGNGMDLYNDYSYLVPLLNAGGFICNNLLIEDPDFSKKLNDTTGPLMIIGDEKILINEATAIESYILSGKGNALFMVSPYSSDIEGSWDLRNNERTNIVEIIENYGVSFTNKIASDISCARITMYTEERDERRVLNYPFWINILPQKSTNTGVMLYWPCVMELNENAYDNEGNLNTQTVLTPLLYTTPAGYYYEAERNNNAEKIIETNPFIVETVNISNKEKKSLAVGYEIEGKITGLYNYGEREDAHLYVIPDQYFVNSLMTGYSAGQFGDYRNFDFVTNLLLKLNNEEELAALQNRAFRDTSLSKISDGRIIEKKKNLSFIILFAVIPLVIILTGLYFNVFFKMKDRSEKNEEK